MQKKYLRLSEPLSYLFHANLNAWKRRHFSQEFMNAENGKVTKLSGTSKFLNFV